MMNDSIPRSDFRMKHIQVHNIFGSRVVAFISCIVLLFGWRFMPGTFTDMQPYTTEMVCCRSIGNRLIILSLLSNIRCVRKIEPAVGTCLTLEGIEHRDTLNIGACNYPIHSRCAKTRGWQDAGGIIIDFNYRRACTKIVWCYCPTSLTCQHTAGNANGGQIWKYESGWMLV